jgi:hypothetical protein
MSIEPNQAVWRVVTKDRDISGIINSVEPLDMNEWQNRIERAVAEGVDVGSYDLEVQIGSLLEKKWTVHVKRVAQIVPF